MSIDQIPADEIVIMTDVLHRSFKAGGCDPMCHCCYNYIKIDSEFKLATANVIEKHNSSSNSGISRLAHPIESREVMLCHKCDVEKLNKKVKSNKCEYEKYRENGGGCYRINGKIVR